MLPGLGRRHFLIGAAASAALVAAGCGSDGEGADGAGASAGDGSDAASTTTEPLRQPDLGGDPFTLGVASGDPATTSVVLWTRLAPEPTADDGGAGMPDDDVPVAWEVAADEGFADVVASGAFTAEAAWGHSVHAVAEGLEPGTGYWYRFTYGEHTSPVGRTATLPDGSPERFAIAVTNCQMYETGAYGAHRHLVDEDVDLVAFLGDYIYEYPGGEGDGRHSLPNRVVQTLGDFRLRYASYKLDPDLAASHARRPWVCTWDDHEVVNNYMGDTRPSDASVEEVQALKASAYQAWWEHMPTRLAPPEGSQLDIYQAVTVGDLATLLLLDQRQYADVPPCRDESIPGLDEGPRCAEVEGEDRTRHGAEQEAWLSESLQASTTTWNLLGNPVVLAGVDVGTDEERLYLDTWDGYPQARRRLIAELAEVSNPVVLTGDYHAGMVLDVQAEPFDASSALVAPEFMAPPISSGLFSADASIRTPQLREQINAHGYLVVEVTPEVLTATFRTVAVVQDPDTPIATASVWEVRAGDPTPAKVEP